LRSNFVFIRLRKGNWEKEIIERFMKVCYFLSFEVSWKKRILRFFASFLDWRLIVAIASTSVFRSIS